MNISNPATARASDRLRPLRYLWRVPVLLVLVLLALPLGALVALLPQGARRPGTRPLADWIVCGWSRALLRGAFGLQLVRRGTPPDGPVLLVANHVSWLDIELLHSQRAACFVAKAEIARWPLIGWLAARAGTIFHRRGHPASLSAVMAVMLQRLREGRAVAVFPEGGIKHVAGGITRVRTFHARVFQCALDAAAPVQPVALVYRREGRAFEAAGFLEHESFLANALRLLGERPFTAEVHFLPPPAVPADAGRRALAEAARAAIAASLEERA